MAATCVRALRLRPTSTQFTIPANIFALKRTLATSPLVPLNINSPTLFSSWRFSEHDLFPTPPPPPPLPAKVLSYAWPVYFCRCVTKEAGAKRPRAKAGKQNAEEGCALIEKLTESHGLFKEGGPSFQSSYTARG